MTVLSSLALSSTKLGGGPRDSAGSENVIQIYGKLVADAIYGCLYRGGIRENL